MDSLEKAIILLSTDADDAMHKRAMFTEQAERHVQFWRTVADIAWQAFEDYHHVATTPTDEPYDDVYANAYQRLAGAQLVTEAFVDGVAVPGTRDVGLLLPKLRVQDVEQWTGRWLAYRQRTLAATVDMRPPPEAG